jgi:two-component system, NarL family, nitrate/nitrite response regulator NarL
MEPTSFGTVLVAPNALLREGLERILNASDFRVLASASESDAPIVSSLPEGFPLLLIIEVNSDFHASLSQIKCFKERYPAARVAVLASPHQLHQLSDIALAFRAGANAFLVDVATSNVFIKSLELVMLGETILPPAILTLLCGKEGGFDQRNHRIRDKIDDRGTRENQVKDSGRADDRTEERSFGDQDYSLAEALPETEDNEAPSLSARQKFILHCLIGGDSNKTIARKIQITEANVKVHIKAILRKIRVQNRTQAAIWAMNNGPSIWAKKNASYHVARVSDGPVS